MELTKNRPASTRTILRQEAKESTIGEYKLVKTIGKGKFAKVKLAKHESTGEEVAIKIIDKTQLKPRSLHKLYRETKIMKMLDHPNIVKLFQIIETRNTLYLVMEYASGGDMCDYLARNGSMKEDEARGKFRQLVSAVQYCHQKGIVHRDLKTNNVLLDRKMNIKLADFGLSNEFTPGNTLETFCGTLHYAAPEIYLKKKYDGPGIDIWSLGVILYMLVSNTLPFASSIFSNLREQVVHGVYRIPPCMTAECANLVKKILVKDPTKRANLDTILKDEWMNHGSGNDAIESHLEPGHSLISQKYDDAFVTYLLLDRNISDLKTYGIRSESRLSLRSVTNQQRVVSQYPSISRLNRRVLSGGCPIGESMRLGPQHQVPVIPSKSIQQGIKRKNISMASFEENSFRLNAELDRARRKPAGWKKRRCL
ncbi:MAP/microtubule affinity-regulating kinase 3-like [Leptinotarsa decemlineata]|uniref:MAP/microtubule affinity-regulating kinase 3-like n=1 Tax=Leptinotarsa decemlineata TaxID=7539 RepID=UPI003D308E28